MKDEPNGTVSADGTGKRAEAALGEPSDIAFKAAVDGTTQRYVLMLPKKFDADREHPLLIALHGHGFDRWQCVRESRDECRGTRDVAARYDAILVSPDYRAPTSWMGPKAEADIVQIIADLRRTYRVNKVVVEGGSMGGTGALTFAAIHPELVHGVSSLNGTANLLDFHGCEDAIEASFGEARRKFPLSTNSAARNTGPNGSPCRLRSLPPGRTSRCLRRACSGWPIY